MPGRAKLSIGFNFVIKSKRCCVTFRTSRDKFLKVLRFRAEREWERNVNRARIHSLPANEVVLL